MTPHARSFTLESNSPISTDPIKARKSLDKSAIARKKTARESSQSVGKVARTTVLRPDNVEEDPEYKQFASAWFRLCVMTLAQQNENYRRCLTATKGASIMNYNPPEVLSDLMAVRDEILATNIGALLGIFLFCVSFFLCEICNLQNQRQNQSQRQRQNQNQRQRQSQSQRQKHIGNPDPEVQKACSEFKSETAYNIVPVRLTTSKGEIILAEPHSLPSEELAYVMTNARGLISDRIIQYWKERGITCLPPSRAVKVILVPLQEHEVVCTVDCT